MVEAEIQIKMKWVELQIGVKETQQWLQRRRRCCPPVLAGLEKLHKQRGRRECSAAEGLREFKGRPV